MAAEETDVAPIVWIDEGTSRSPFGSVSAASSASTHLPYDDIETERLPGPRPKVRPALPKQTSPVRLSPSARITSPSRPRSPRSPFSRAGSVRDQMRRQQLVWKQTQRQSISPAFFEPNDDAPRGTADSFGGTSGRNGLPLVADGRGAGRRARLTAQALSAHDDPAGALLAVPISSLSPDDDDDHDARAKAVRRCASFNAAIGLPTINVIKAIPDCLDDHSNPSSRDPFYYDRVLRRIDAGQQKANKKVKRQESNEWSGASVGSGGVTAWVVDSYV